MAGKIGTPDGQSQLARRPGVSYRPAMSHRMEVKREGQGYVVVDGAATLGPFASMSTAFAEVLARDGRVHLTWSRRVVAGNTVPRHFEASFHGEDAGGIGRLRSLWPEFYDPSVAPEDLRAVAESETGAAFMREPDELCELLGWERRSAGPWLDHWVAAPAARALATARRRSSGAPEAAASEGGALGLSAWLRAAAGYLPRGLGRVPDERAAPIQVAGAAE